MFCQPLASPKCKARLFAGLFLAALGGTLAALLFTLALRGPVLRRTFRHNVNGALEARPRIRLQFDFFDSCELGHDKP